jgi:hypothetical protein
MIHYYLTKGAHKLSAVISVCTALNYLSWCILRSKLLIFYHVTCTRKLLKKHTLEIQNDFTMCSLLTLKYMFSIAFSA